MEQEEHKRDDAPNHRDAGEGPEGERPEDEWPQHAGNVVGFAPPGKHA